MLAMDWKLLATTFSIVFLAEIGDKTQLAALALTGRSGAPLAVFLGASTALVAATAIGVAAGATLNRLVPDRWLDIGAALLFLAVGGFLLVRTFFFTGGPEA
jgi:putative Ca2+/H+ antiporter (TMEM165/GDT1 family)